MDKLGRYAPVLVLEFYVAYIATILHDLPNRKRPLTQPRLTEVLVRGRHVNILEEIIHFVHFCLVCRAPRSTPEFDYGLRQAKTALILKAPV